MPFSFKFPYDINPEFKVKVAYCCMEYGIHQPLKTYAGGLGILAGSHMRSAYELKQPMIGIGIFWKYGYYDQIRKEDQRMDVLFQEKRYGFLQETGIRFSIIVSGQPVWVTAYYLPPTVFNTAPIFFLSTDLPENDYLAKTISFKLYDSNPETQIAAAILLGTGTVKLMEAINWQPDIYHLNESHALPLLFSLYKKYNSREWVKERLVFTNHTPEKAGNQQSSLSLLEKMGFFCSIPIGEIRAITGTEGDVLDHTLTALRFAKRANAVSKLHQQTLREIWNRENDICDIIAITNAQNYSYWHDEEMYEALHVDNDKKITERKKKGKQALFDVVADQCGEIYDSTVCTIVFAKRFAGYKRADLLLNDMDKFHRLVTNKDRPVQIIWAGKPYPVDYAAISIYDKIADLCKNYANCSILSGYELRLTKILKSGADVWLNVPRLTHEACGTSGMSAAMNGAINVALPDGWFPEFAKDNVNSFIIPPADKNLPEHEQDRIDANNLFQTLENIVLPVYYDHPDQWTTILKNGLSDIIPRFESNRMAKEYYEKLYI
jgi:starch phosphorylase